jgi:GDP-L-fucose synthase
MELKSRIYIAGHKGMVGSAIKRKLELEGYTNIIFADSSALDLTNQPSVSNFFKTEKPEYVFLAAAKVGGIMANNTYRAQFIYENLMIQNNVIHNAYTNGVKKLLFLGSSCIYPRLAPQPLKEEYLLTSELEYTNEPYAIAKIAGIKMIESYNIQYGTDYIAVMPTNLYGPNDNYDLQKSHVLPAMMRKMYLATCLENNDWPSIRKDLQKRPLENIEGNSSKEEILNILPKYGILTTGQHSEIPNRISSKSETLNPKLILWGSGNPLREFMHVDDLAAACVHIMEKVSFKDLVRHLKSEIQNPKSKIINTHINLGTGQDLSIRDLAEMIMKIVGFKGTIEWDPSKPDGTPRKLMDVSKMKSLGYTPTITLEEGIKSTFNNYISY